MSATLVAIIVLAGIGWLLIKKCASDMVNEELRARVDDLPAVFLEFALRRLPDRMREQYRPEWEDDLAAFNSATERYPLSRFASSFKFAVVLLLRARSVQRDLTAAYQQDEASERLERWLSPAQIGPVIILKSRRGTVLRVSSSDGAIAEFRVPGRIAGRVNLVKSTDQGRVEFQTDDGASYSFDVPFDF